MRRLIPVLAVMTLAITGCSEQIDQTVNDLASRALDSGIREQLEAVGVSLDGDVDCSTDFSRDGTTLSGDADCTAQTTEGEGVEATFSGTLSPSGCDGSLMVTVAGRSVVDISEIPDCNVSL
ncbi:MAG: hypothetical protein ACRDVZ_14915 [Jiangellaceae bacterium]